MYCAVIADMDTRSSADRLSRYSVISRPPIVLQG
jgi:hypothetical protein